MVSTVTVCEALVVFKSWPVKVNAAGVSVATGITPMPVRLIVCVLPATPLLLSVIVTVPVRVPVAVGEKFTLMGQL